MNRGTPEQPAPKHEEIEARARQLWQIAGSPSGRDQEFWLAAESEIKVERRQVKRTAGKKAAGST